MISFGPQRNVDIVAGATGLRLRPLARMQSKLRNAMWLFGLVFTYVVVHGFGRCLPVWVSTLFPPFPSARLSSRQFNGRTICVMTRYQDDLESLAKRSKTDSTQTRARSQPVATSNK